MKHSANIAEFLNKDITEISDAELLEIIDAELEKDEAEMNTELIDECLLCLKNRKKAADTKAPSAGKKPRISILRLLIAAVIICSVITTFFVMSPSEQVEINIPEESAYYGDNCIEIKRDNIRTSADAHNIPDCELKQKLVSALEIEPTLPKALCSGYKITEEHTQDKSDETDFAVTHDISLKNEVGEVSLSVTREDIDRSTLEAFARSAGGYMNPRRADMLFVNGMDIALIENKSSTVFVEYYDGNVCYCLQFYNGFTYEEVIEIMKTVC